MRRTVVSSLLAVALAVSAAVGAWAYEWNCSSQIVLN